MGRFVLRRNIAVRVVVVLHLCFVLCYLSWNILYPFTGEYLWEKSESLLYRTVLGDSLLVEGNSTIAQAQKEQLRHNAVRFKQLPGEVKDTIGEQYQLFQQRAHASFFAKVWQGITNVAFLPSPFTRMWVLLSFAVSIFLLLRVSGAQQAVWLLPILILLSGIFSVNSVHPHPKPVDSSLFPSEQYLAKYYLERPLQGGAKEQRQLLETAWSGYLIREWGGEEPAESGEARKEQSEKALYAFNLARIEQRGRNPSSNIPILSPTYQGGIVFFLPTLAWNLFFALFVFRQARRALVAR
ncbi:hypothetical protein JYU14_03400 [Simkania negevensis]|uniref:Uncharacterized protein n=1 Tax=Simkania negevensis TaxID=83561 RepID=A0ABS3ARW4_9BACT|nr:hypothetical protein [Simkania negevensis]